MKWTILYDAQRHQAVSARKPYDHRLTQALTRATARYGGA